MFIRNDARINSSLLWWTEDRGRETPALAGQAEVALTLKLTIFWNAFVH
ncbi:hypothetical protein SAMN04489724_3301 [Algoriphagus locisalis]|uniref:Uncharacterized protein n=1 Tax=Algoriphagus locisalis TaxID=305507 RepID=A0A1I7CQE3_9BACT|nr:hypothetical protein [Algoriphagus locisalis]SFU01539.1 hypothetical protein SAMN04489724_3301 [Algoriphagus locisalis]